jgi:hypothetical protein
MTDEERKQEAAEEEIEDLNAPAETQEDVVGGLTVSCRCCGPGAAAARPLTDARAPEGVIKG